MDKSNSVGRLQGRSSAVDFIDERLPQHDRAFLNAPSVFDSTSDRYLPVIPAQLNHKIAGQSILTSLALRPQTFSVTDTVTDQISQYLESQSMTFWNDIFSEAKKVLLTNSNEPTILAKSGGGIRHARSWEEVCALLTEARIAYTDGEGAAGKARRIRRKLAETMSQPAAQVAKMIPDIDPWATPVVGTVGLLLQAVRTAAKTRQEVLTSLSDLETTFSNINSFAATFPKDKDIREASVHLVAAIFQAVEQAMGFFAKSAGRKAAMAVLAGGDYQKELLDSFTEVHKRSDCLIQKAQNSHFATTRTAIMEVLYRQAQAQAQAAKQSADMMNTIKDMMEMYERELERGRKQHQEELMLHRGQHQELLAIMCQSQATLRPVSPLPATLALPPPPPPLSTHTAAIPCFPIWTAQTLLQLLGVPDISASDLQRVKEQDSTLFEREKTKADQVLQTELFRQWMRCLGPAKLLIHGVFRDGITVSPLSLLTATFTEAARADRHRFVSLVFFCGLHLDDEDGDTLMGGKALIQVLISQLLQQQPHMNIAPSPSELDMDLVRQMDLQQLCQLLNLLVHGLPGGFTLFCLIDGMAYYERDEFVDEMQYVLTEILRLVGDPTIQANVKLLITSPWRTEMAQQYFHEDLEILHMEGMPPMELAPSASGVIDHHILHTESDQYTREGSSEFWE